MKKAICLLVTAFVWLNIVAQPKFEKLYRGSDAIISLQGDFFAVKQDSKWAVFKNKTMILDYYYDSIDVLSDGVITYIKNNRAGFADTVGNLITSAIYPLETPYNRADESLLNVFQSGSALVYDSDKLILLGKDGKKINPDDVEIVSKADNVVVFKRKSAYGLLDAMGNELVSNKYRRIQTVIAGELYAYTGQKNGMDVLGLINKAGKVISKAEYDDLTVISKNDKFYIKAFAQQTGKQALYDAQGNLLFNPIYQNVEPINSSEYFIFTDNGRKGIVGSNYVVLVPAVYDDIKLVTIKENQLFVAKNENKTYILDENNTNLDVFDGNIKDFVSYKQGNEAIYIADSMLNYGVRSSKRGWLIAPQYFDVFAQVNGKLIVRKKDKWGAVDMKNNEIIPFEYGKVRASTAKTCIVFYDGKTNSMILQEDGKKRDFPKTKSVLPMQNYIEYKVKKEWKRLYFNGAEIAGRFLSIGSDKDGILCARTKKGWSYFNSKTYEPLTEQYFSFATGFNNGVAYVVKDTKLYQIDREFNIIQTILDENYVDLNNTASLLSMSGLLKKNTVRVTDKNGKQTLIKIIKD